MSKKKDKEDLDRLNATYDAIFNDVAEMPLEDVRRALEDLGVDREALRNSLHSLTTRLARDLRTSGQSAPPYLSRVIEQSADVTELPQDPKRALDKAKQYLDGLLGPVVTPGRLEISAAFRGDTELSDRDRETIQELEAELRKRAETKGEDDEG
jgi:hypothetical protein